MLSSRIDNEFPVVDDDDDDEEDVNEFDAVDKCVPVVVELLPIVDDNADLPVPIVEVVTEIVDDGIEPDDTDDTEFDDELFVLALLLLLVDDDSGIDAAPADDVLLFVDADVLFDAEEEGGGC